MEEEEEEDDDGSKDEEWNEFGFDQFLADITNSISNNSNATNNPTISES